MFIIKRNQILIVTLVLMIAVAGYLNYSDKRLTQNEILKMQEGIDIIPNIEMTSVGSDLTLVDTKDEGDHIGVATFVSTTMAEELEDPFFMQAKINREQSREERKEWLMELINTSAVDQQNKNDAMSEIISIQNRIEKETAIESLIESKGFGSVYVRIDENGVDVVVDKQNLSQNEIAQISDIVTRKSGFAIDKIKINSLKKSE